jgi:hypothetical protein
MSCLDSPITDSANCLKIRAATYEGYETILFFALVPKLSNSTNAYTGTPARVSINTVNASRVEAFMRRFLMTDADSGSDHTLATSPRTKCAMNCSSTKVDHRTLITSPRSGHGK